MSLYLVSCVSKKVASPAPAKDLYISQLFRKSRAYVESIGQPWFILSAKYGLVHPDQAIAPYDLTLNKMNAAECRRWADTVVSQLRPHLEDENAVVFLAGRRYQQFLESKLIVQGVVLFDPLEGMRIGERMNWLDRNTHG